jgi:hypothetical protein
MTGETGQWLAETIAIIIGAQMITINWQIAPQNRRGGSGCQPSAINLFSAAAA